MTEHAAQHALLPPGGILESDSGYNDLRENHCSRCGDDIAPDGFVLLLWPLTGTLTLFYQYCDGCSVAGHA